MRSSAFAAAVALAACTFEAEPQDAGLPPDSGAVDAGGDPDAGAGVEPDAGAPDAGDPDAGMPDGDPTRRACVNQYGAALTGTFGRLDGLVVSLVPANTSACYGDATHLHMQVLMKGEIYDVAVNLDTDELETATDLPGGPWSEGWHPAGLDYVATLGLHASQFVPHSIADARSLLEARLAHTNHISVYATPYGGRDGAHDVHRHYSNQDGALVLEPLSGSPRLLAFRFSNQNF